MIKKIKNKAHLKDETLRKAFLRLLLKAPLREVKFSGSRVSLTFFGHRLSDKVVIKTEDHVAEWSRKRKEVFIDREITDKDRRKSLKALCVHEVIEKFLNEKFGLRTETEAHTVATKKEKEYLESLGGNWRSHELIVYWDWHRQGER